VQPRAGADATLATTEGLNHGEYGKLTEFRPDVEQFSAYCERVELFFAVNEVPGEKQVPLFLNCIGAATYSLLRNLVAPENPKDKTLAALMSKLKDHFEVDGTSKVYIESL